MRRIVAALGLECACAAARGQAIKYDAASQVFRLQGGGVSYVMGVNTSGELQSIYWGPQVGAGDPFARAKPVNRAFELTDTPQEYAGWGGGIFTEPALKV